MTLSVPEVTNRAVSADRMARVKALPECITYCKDEPTGNRRHFRLSIYGIYTTGEYFVEVTGGPHARVRSFQSRHKACLPEARREGMPLVDVADAFSLARFITQRWPRRWCHGR